MKAITADNLPKEEDFLDFFLQKKNNGHSFNTLKCQYSHINKILKLTYSYDLFKYPKIWEFVKAQEGGNYQLIF